MMGFNLQLGDALRSESVTAIDDAIRAIVRQEIARTPRTKFCDACAYMHQPDISARCCCVACHGDDVPAWAQRMNTPLSSEKTGDASPASEVKACPFCGGRARLISHESPEVTNYGYEVNCDECAAQGPSTDCEWDGNAEYAKRDAIAAWNRRAPAPSPESEVVLDMPETDSGPLGRAQLEALHRLLAPVLDAAGFSPAHETAKKAIERLLAQWRSGLEPRVPPSPASFSLNPGASKTPGSQQASEELDELLRMHARHDNDDTEDCWTKPAVRAIQYLSDLRWDLQVTTNRAAILAETNESLRRMIADMAAYAGTTFGADEPVKNAEVVKKALAPSPASGEGARMTTREREEILKNDEIALAIADGMARCADVFCDQAQLDRRREAARMTHKRLADSRELLADLRAEAVAAWAAAEAAEERCSYKACGCMYDRKDDVCSVHSPIVSKVTAERDAARSELAALLASRAPRPSPQPSVEELARKIAARIYGDDGQYVEPQHHAWQAAEVALAALSAMPASEELTDAEAQRLYDDAAKDAKPFGDHEVERFVRVTVDPQAEVLALQKQRNDVYEERDRLVAALSKCFPSWLARHPDSDKGWDDDWRWIVFVQLPTGQATWHIHDRELAWFDHLEVRENSWDGHTTEEKYRRLERLPAREAQGEPTLEECETAYDEAWRNADIGSLSVDDIKNPGVAAVRSLCLAHRAPATSSSATDSTERGWLIERNDKPSPLWWCGHSSRGMEWTPNSLEAIRFARKVDADMVNVTMLASCGVTTEHYWVAPWSPGRNVQNETAPAPSPASWRIEIRGSQPQCWVVVDPSGDAGEQSFTVGPCFDEDEREDAEHFARMTRVALERMSIRLPSPALAAIVEAGDAMRNYFDETTLTMNRVKDKDAPGLMWALTEEYVSGATPILTDWDRARAALPKDGA